MKTSTIAVALAPLAALSAVSLVANGQPNPIRTSFWHDEKDRSGAIVTGAAALFAAYWLLKK